MSDQDDETNDGTQQRDKLLLRLLKTPPQPRPKRERSIPPAKAGRPSPAKRKTAGKREG